MPEQFQKILNRIIEWWKKFTTKQRVILISIVAVVILSLVILAVTVTRPHPVLLISCESAKDAATVAELLTGEQIAYDLSSDGLTYYVDEKDRGRASVLLGSNEIPAEGYSIEDVVTGSFSMTTADRQILYKDFLEKKFATDLEELEMIEGATVTLTIPEDNGTILSSEKEKSASVTLELKGDMDEEQAKGIARYIATGLGNPTTEGITIINRKNSMILFSGAETNSATGVTNSQLNYKVKQENLIKNQIAGALLNSKIFSTVDVALNLDIKFSDREVATHDYSTPEGQTTGPPSEKSEYESETTGGNAGVPGTDSNDADTTYVTEDNEYTHSSVSETKTKYDNNEVITKETSTGGIINYGSSSVSVVATRTVVYDEKTMEKAGELDEISFAEFKRQHSDPVMVENIDPSFVQMVAKATGFPEENIAFMIYENPQFIEKNKTAITVSNVLQIVLAVLIFALLGYVVYRSTRSEKVPEIQPEVSVEELLDATAGDDDMENIGYTEKSETRIMIEKFVDEKPEAVAILLRNWLNEEWD